MTQTLQNPTKFKTVNHEVIHLFVNVEKNKGNKLFWPKEMSICKKILKQYPIEFLRKLKNPLKNGDKIPSLAWFLTENGKQFLSSEFFEYQKKNTNLQVYKEEISFSETKIGEDIKIIKKPQTLKEFLEYYGKKD